MTMIERVARAIFAARWPHADADKVYARLDGVLHDALTLPWGHAHLCRRGWRWCQAEAEAAIYALREPTDDIVSGLMSEIYATACHSCECWIDGQESGWRAAIDAALKETP